MKPKAKSRGIVCPECRGGRLFVKNTVRPMAGLVVRYRDCRACGHRVITEERVRRENFRRGSNRPIV